MALPPTFSLLFGPAAAWGTAIGNLIGDLQGGTFSPGSLFGFLGNFLLGVIPYALWGRLGILSVGGAPRMQSRRQWVEYGVILGIASLACAAVIGWGTDLLRLFPYAVLGNIVALNNFLFGLLGLPLLALLYRRVERWGLLWTDVMSPREVSHGSASLGVLLFCVGAIGAAITGNILSIGVLHSPAFGAGLGRLGDSTLVGKPVVIGGVAPFIVCLLLGLVVGRGATEQREQGTPPST